MRRLTRICIFINFAACLTGNVAAIPDCAFKQVRQGNDCVARIDIDGGAWHGDELHCNNGYAPLYHADKKPYCHELPRLTNGFYQGPLAKCPGQFVLVNWICTPKSMVRDKSLIMDSARFCPPGYTERDEKCIPKPEQRTLNVGKITIQHLYLGMTEELVFNALLDNDYEHYEDPTMLHSSRGFRKTEADGTYREIIVKLNGSPLTVYDIHYTQAFPTSTYEFGAIRSRIVSRYGAPSEVGFYRGRDVLRYRDGKSSSAPVLEVTFPDNRIIFHLASRTLENRLIEQALLARQRVAEQSDQHKPAAELEF